MDNYYGKRSARERTITLKISEIEEYLLSLEIQKTGLNKAELVRKGFLEEIKKW